MIQVHHKEPDLTASITRELNSAKHLPQMRKHHNNSHPSTGSNVQYTQVQQLSCSIELYLLYYIVLL